MIDLGMPTLIEYPDIEDCASLCKRLGLQFIELNMNLPQYQPEKIESPVFGLTLDIGHNHGIGGTDETIIMNRADKLRHMHIHDASGRKNHLSPGDGEVNIKKFFRVAKKHNCRAVLETKTISGLIKSVEWVDNNL